MVEPVLRLFLSPRAKKRRSLCGIMAVLLFGLETSAQTTIPSEVVEQARPYLIELGKEATLDNRTYRFDQNLLVRNLTQACTDLADHRIPGDDAKKTAPSFSKESTGEILAYRLAYCVLAAGEFATPSEELTIQLNRVARDFGVYPIPEGVTTPERQYFGAASMSFVDDSGEALDATGLLEKPRMDFNDIVSGAKLKMAVRSNSQEDH